MDNVTNYMDEDRIGTKFTEASKIEETCKLYLIYVIYDFLE